MKARKPKVRAIDILMSKEVSKKVRDKLIRDIANQIVKELKRRKML